MAKLFTDLQAEVLVELGSDTTSSFYTEKNIRDWLDASHKWAAAYHKWPQTEYKDKSGAFTSGTETYSYPNAGFRTDSIRILQIGSDLFQKKNFEDYLKYRENYPDRDDKYFSDYGRTLYVNPNCSSGTIYAYGQLTPKTLGSVASSTASTVFANSEDEVDEAIIEKTISLAFRKAKKINESIAYENSAKQKLEEAWKRITDEQASYQNISKNMFADFDVLDGEINETNNPLQF
jgi:hypothetical protein